MSYPVPCWGLCSGQGCPVPCTATDPASTDPDRLETPEAA